MPDYTKAAKTKAARPISDLIHQMPLPVGGIDMSKATAMEKARMEKLGVPNEKMLPGNFVELSRKALELAVSDDLDSPLPADTPPLKLDEIDITKLPADQRVRYEAILKDSLAQMNRLMTGEDPELAGLNSSVAAAVAAGNRPVPAAPSRPVIDDTKQANYSTGAPKSTTVRPPAPAAKSEEPKKEEPAADTVLAGFCSRCGFPKDRTDDVEITEMEEEVYFDCLMSGRPFEKVFHYYNGKLSIRVRGLLLSEMDAIRRQLTVMRSKRDTSLQEADFLVYIEQLQNCLQLVSIHANGKDLLVCPGSLDEWLQVEGINSVEDVRAKLCAEDVPRSLSTYRQLQRAVNQFNALEHKLEQLSQNESFYKAGNTDS